MPINKGLWTPSYVVYTAGLALLALGVCYWLIDVKGYRAWSTPAVIFGMNAIAIFVLSGFVGRGMAHQAWSPTATDDERVGLRRTSTSRWDSRR